MGVDKNEIWGDTAEEESFEEQEVEVQVWVWWGSKSTVEGDGFPKDMGEALWEDHVLPGKVGRGGAGGLQRPCYVGTLFPTAAYPAEPILELG